MKSADTAFGRELEVFRSEEETAQQLFFSYLALHNLPANDRDILRLMNEAPLFWITTRHALLLAAFVVLGRLFDQKSRHNLDRLLNLAMKDRQLFSKAGLAKRRQKEGMAAAQAAAYAAEAYEPTAADFRILRKQVATRRRIYEARYRDIRDKIFAHKALSNTADTDQLFKKTNIEEMKALFAFLHALHNALWELLFNGRRHDLRIEQFNSKPIRGRSNKPGEMVTEQAEDFFLLRLNANLRQPCAWLGNGHGRENGHHHRRASAHACSHAVRRSECRGDLFVLLGNRLRDHPPTYSEYPQRAVDVRSHN